LVLEREVFLELVVVFNDFVTATFHVVNEWTRSFGQKRLAVVEAEEVGAIL
jgi:hypothetical protein